LLKVSSLKSENSRKGVCDPDWTQTSDLLLRRQLLYSAELPDLTVLNGGKDSGNKEKIL
jgi:hypothetical protein